MALSKVIVVDKIEVMENGQVQVRTVTMAVVDVVDQQVEAFDRQYRCRILMIPNTTMITATTATITLVLMIVLTAVIVRTPHTRILQRNHRLKITTRTRAVTVAVTVVVTVVVISGSVCPNNYSSCYNDAGTTISANVQRSMKSAIN